MHVHTHTHTLSLSLSLSLTHTHTHTHTHRFRKAKGEVAHFIDSKRVLPGLIDTIMCGCGGNVYAVAVTNKRVIVQNDKRCLFGSTVCVCVCVCE